MTKIEMIERINEIAAFWNDSLESEAMEVVLYPDDAEKMASAQETLVKKQERAQMARQVIDVINGNWPKPGTGL